MLANRAVASILLKKNAPLSITQTAAYATGGYFDQRAPIGKREWVGYGINGQPNYCDSIEYPLPAIRFKEITGELVALREKEKGDWKNLTIEEKKKLYRASFRCTLVEEEAPTGRWKSCVGFTLIGVSLGLWLYYMEKIFIYRPLPKTFSDEHRADTLRAMIDLKTGLINGLSSKWDYEKDNWKK